MKLDSTDIQLINMLQENCKRPIKELAAELNLSIAPVHERIKKIERAGYIKRYVAIVDIEKINRPLINYCSVTLLRHNTDYFKEFERQIRWMDQILECYYVSGNTDYLLKVISSDMNEYQDFILNKLSKLEMISNINSQFVMKHIKFKTSVNI
ncbi:MAG: Lrp/AsnC family transcriptional regulator [Crocinitomicaceae bacterium]|nr:Lrp/AsnC family transcriptional regulator [Crocinitomicaceae bacterium]